MIAGPLPPVLWQAVEAVEARVVDLLHLVRHDEHVATDPACVRYTDPRGRLGLWWYDANRGRPCPACRPRRLAALPTPRTAAARSSNEGCVRSIDRLTCCTHGDPWPCPRLGRPSGARYDGDGGPCPLDCGRYVARVLLAGHLELHRRGVVGGVVGGGR